MIDTRYDKVRIEDRVMTLGLIIAHGVNSDGIMEILAVEPILDESESSWRAFSRNWKKSGCGGSISVSRMGMPASRRP
jgi:transposase-like protein